MRPVKRTFAGIEFTFRRNTNGGIWVSADDIQLSCACGLRRPLSDHWSVYFEGVSWCSGMTAEEAVLTFLRLREENRA